MATAPDTMPLALEASPDTRSALLFSQPQEKDSAEALETVKINIPELLPKQKLSQERFSELVQYYEKLPLMNESCRYRLDSLVLRRVIDSHLQAGSCEGQVLALGLAFQKEQSLSIELLTESLKKSSNDILLYHVMVAIQSSFELTSGQKRFGVEVPYRFPSPCGPNYPTGAAIYYENLTHLRPFLFKDDPEQLSQLSQILSETFKSNKQQTLALQVFRSESTLSGHVMFLAQDALTQKFIAYNPENTTFFKGSPQQVLREMLVDYRNNPTKLLISLQTFKMQEPRVKVRFNQS